MPPLPTCGTGCEFTVPPQSILDECNPIVSDGEITRLYVSGKRIPLATLSNASLFLDAVLNPPAPGDQISVIEMANGRDSVADPTSQEIEGGITVYEEKDEYTLNGEFYNDTDTNYQAAQKYQACKRPVYIYYVAGGKLYGGAANVEDGIQTTLRVVPVHGGTGTKRVYNVTATWKEKGLPQRITHSLEGVQLVAEEGGE
jgi:hypothetical protein